LEFGSPLEQLPIPITEEHNDYHATSDRLIIQFMAGFTSFKRKKITKHCEECQGSLEKTRSEATEADRWILTQEIHGGLTLPSTELANLITSVEYAACKTMSNYGVHEDMAFTTLQNLNINASCFVGCLSHTSELTKKIVEYYLITRMYFAGDMKKQEMEKLKERSKQKRKSSKV